MTKQHIHIAIDGNEANVGNRVGSNVYAFQLLKALSELINAQSSIKVTVLLSSQALADLPPESDLWHYEVLEPRSLWTQWTLPLHLFRHRHRYNLLFTPGHYAPRFCPIPYVSSVMDTAYLTFPHQFTKTDYMQLKHWTGFSVRGADKVIAISQATKSAVVGAYKKRPSDVVVAYPGLVTFKQAISKQRQEKILKQLKVKQPYFLYVGTIQPRKNIELLVEAFEVLTRMISSRSLTDSAFKKRNSKHYPQLVVAGKIGWLSESIQERINKSSERSSIVQTGFVTEEQKHVLLSEATVTILLGEHEGFGLPPLESMGVGTPALVSNAQSLPEVVGNAGFVVKSLTPSAVAKTMLKAHLLTAKQKAAMRRLIRQQISTFTWEKTAQVVLDTLLNVIHEH